MRGNRNPPEQGSEPAALSEGKDCRFPSGWRPDGWVFLALGAALSLNMLFPGDTPWISDEPLLVLKALNHNQQGRLAQEGFRSVTTGITYGPVAVWFYQGMLLVSRNPVHLVFLKAFGSSSILVAGLLFLGRRLNLSPWPILLGLLSPYLYLSHRMLWDNVLLVPLSLLFWCCALLFHEERKPIAFACGLVLAILMLHIHIMSALLIIPVGGLLVCSHAKWFLRHPLWMILSIAVLIVTLFPYLFQVKGGGYFPRSETGTTDTLGQDLMGPSLFSFLGFGPYFLPGAFEGEWLLPRSLGGILMGMSALAVVLFSCGLMGSLWEVGMGIRARTWTGRHLLSACAILVVLVKSQLFWLTGISHHPHYHHGVWFASFYLIWRGWQWGLQWAGNWARLLWGLQVASTGILLWAVVVFLHLSGGMRGIHYGPTLSNQMAAVLTVLKFSPESTLCNRVEHFDLFPHAFRALVRLLDDRNVPAKRPLRSLTLVQEQDPAWFWIDVGVAPHAPVPQKCGPGEEKPHP